MAGRSTGLLTFANRERRVPLRGRITKQLAACCIARLVVLGTEHQELPIVIYIESPGGAVADALPILSTMNGIHCPIASFCTGEIGTMAAVIAARGLPGYRTASPGTRFSFKALSGSNRRMHSDASFLQVVAETLSQITHQPTNEVVRWLTEGAQFNAQQAVAAGLIDSVASRPLLPNAAAL